MGAFLRATNRSWHWHTQKLLPNPFKCHSLKNCWNYSAEMQIFQNFQRKLLSSKTLKGHTYFGSLISPKAKAMGSQRLSWQISKFKWIIKRIMISSIQTRSRGKRGIKTYPWWTNYAQVSGVEWLNIFTCHNTQGYATSFMSLPYYFTHLCTSCSWAMQYVGVCLGAWWPHMWEFIAFPCLPQPLDQRTGVWRGGMTEHC